MDILQLRDLLCQKQLSFLTISNISFLENCAVLSPEIELNSFLRTVIKIIAFILPNWHTINFTFTTLGTFAEY